VKSVPGRHTPRVLPPDVVDATGDEVDRAAGQLPWVASFEELSRVVVSAARTVAGADGATFVVRDGDRCFYVDEDAMAPLWRGQRFPITQCISGWAMRHGEPAQIPDIRVDPRIPQEAYRPTFVRSLVSVPIGADESIGAVGVYWERVGQVLDETSLAALLCLAAEAERAMRRLGLETAPWAPNFLLDRA
jgi:GAF domain-containing protein